MMSPLVLAIAFVLYGTLAQRRKLVLVTICLFYSASMPVVARTIFGLIEGPAIRLDPQNLPKADAIVVLSGMLSGVRSPTGIVYEWSDPDRFFGGIELFKLGKSDNLVFTEGQSGWNDEVEPEGRILKRYAQAMGIPAGNIRLTRTVTNTEGEAAAVRQLLGGGGASILLVTSAFHMPRAVLLFEKQGLEVHPYPVDFQVELHGISPLDFLPSPGALSLTSLAIRESIGRLYYRAKLSTI